MLSPEQSYPKLGDPKLKKTAKIQSFGHAGYIFRVVYLLLFPKLASVASETEIISIRVVLEI